MKPVLFGIALLAVLALLWFGVSTYRQKYGRVDLGDPAVVAEFTRKFVPDCVATWQSGTLSNRGFGMTDREAAKAREICECGADETVRILKRHGGTESEMDALMHGPEVHDAVRGCAVRAGVSFY